MTDILFLDSEGVSLLVRRDRTMLSRMSAARKRDARIMVSAVTLVEARDPSMHQARFDWVLSSMKIQPITEAIARHASKLLAAASLHGHKYAMDALLCATALAQPGPITILTSDTEDIEMLTSDESRIRTVKV